MIDNVPYYARHKVTELTCPHCKAMLTFIINERDHSVFSCGCGRWFRDIDIVQPTPAVWRYQARADYADKHH